MAPTQPNTDDPLAHLDAPMREAVLAAVPIDDVRAVAPYNLDTHGHYIDAYLVLTETRLGRYRPANQTWQWFELKDLDDAALVEGLGMSLLRLLRDHHAVAEFRFTLRCAKEMARLHRRMEKLIGAEEPPADEADRPTGDEKKLRCEKCGRVIPPWAETCPSCLSRRKVLSRLMDFVKPYKARAAMGLAAALLITGASLLRPALTKPMLDYGLGAAEGATPNYQTLLVFIFMLAGLTVFVALGGALRQRLMASLGSRIARDVRDKAYQHLHKLSLSFFSRKPTGSLITRITSDSDRIWDFVAFTMVELIIAVLTISGVGVALFILNWKLACFVLIPVPLMLVLMMTFHNKMHRFFRRIFHRWSQMTAVVSDAIPGVRVIKAFSQERREVDRFAEHNQRVYDGEMTMINLWTMFGPVLQLCSQVGSLLVWIIGGYWVVRDYFNPPTDGPVMTVGTLMAFIGYMWMFYEPIHMLSHMDRQLNRAATSVQRIFEILDTEPAIYSKTGAHRPEELTGKIELRNVSFSYDGVRKVLQDVSITVAPGEMIGLAGPSGAGKSTLVNLICRMYDVLEGKILIDDVDVRDYELEALRQQIGVVLQEPFLFRGTIAQNIAYGRPNATLDDILAAARAANAHDFIVGFPDGYDTIVGERGQTLSGGERQRVSIARAILNDPKLLILDEATSSVDTETEKLIQGALDNLVANRTTIAIAHRLSTLAKADRLVILEGGKVAEQGSHAELENKKDGVYARLLRMQREMKSIIAING